MPDEEINRFHGTKDLRELYLVILPSGTLHLEWMDSPKAVAQSEMNSRPADRWRLYFGILFIPLIIFFPRGVVGTATQIMAQRIALTARQQKV